MKIPESEDIKYMRRCIELALKGEGMTYPNPVVGSVIVHEGRITGEGFHLKSGGPHAEVFAVNSVANRNTLTASTLYVNLEPCSHFGQTPPCTDMIISLKIPKIVIGTTDTSDKVSGSGIKKLKDAGCEVITGVLEEECRWLNRRFFTYHEKKRPYIILKWAQSSDGYIDVVRDAGSSTEPYWITGKPERVLVHKWRASEQAILIGGNTLRTDRPRLNVREWEGSDPVRIVLSKSGYTGNFMTNGECKSPVILFTQNRKPDIEGAEVVLLNDQEPAAVQIYEYLYLKGIQSLFIEGGAKVLDYFISGGYWDEARIFSGNISFKNGVKAPVIQGRIISKDLFSGSMLEIRGNEF